MLVKGLHKKRKVDATGLLTNDPREILEDEEIKVVIEAIGRISPAEEDIKKAKEWGYEFKLFAWAKKFKNYVSAGVEPTLVPENSLISKVKEVNNAK